MKSFELNLPSEPPELVILADRVHTFVTDAVPVNAVHIRNGRIVAVGDAHTLRRRAPSAEVLDLRGTTLTPGFTDSHIHLVEWALARRDADLTESRSPEEAAAIVKTHPGEAAWVKGRGWNPHRWTAAPHRALLDAAVPDRPAAMQSHDMHSVWVNTRALEAAGISADTADPPGGRIERGPDGVPTGLLQENATQLVIRVMAPPGESEALEAVLEAQRELHSLGITGVHSLPGLYVPEPDPLPVLELLRSRGQLALRVLQHIRLERLDMAIGVGLRSGFGGEWIRIGAVKMFLDGALGSRTAWMLQPYESSRDRGINVLPPDEFREHVRRAAAAGIATIVHAIGDAAVSLALEELSKPELRVPALAHRIEHVQCCPVPRLGDAGRAGIVCSVQPAHLITDWSAADRHWGAARARGTYAFRSLAAGGALLAFGSDAPVEPVDPRLGLFAATVRQDLDCQPVNGWFPEERIDILDAVRAYTVAPANAAGWGNELGFIAPGALADIVAWDRDPLVTSGPELLQLGCVATIVNGTVVWK